MSEAKQTMSSKDRMLLRYKTERARRRVEFRRQEWFRYKRLGESWRKPRGKHSKQREQQARRPPIVDAGYRGPASVRGLHPSGYREILVHTTAELDSVDRTRFAVRIGSSVGSRKREMIENRADELKIKVLNREVK
ncbi:MAG: 50S ribosomal protein L32e [Thermoplasmataceae archaeon]